MNKVCRLLRAATIVAGLVVSAAAQKPFEQPKAVKIDIYYRVSWILAPSVAPESPADGLGSHSLLLTVMRAVNPNNGEPYDNSTPGLSFATDDLRHFFRLEKKDFLLGEPILIEHRIELNGPGEWEWSVGGNYRARGRDDNFSFILRREDGFTVPDTYPKLEGIVLGGGLGSNPKITKDKPLSYWLGLQRYAAITEPGTYDLYCFTGSKSIKLGLPEATRAALPDEIKVDHYIDDNGVLIDRTTGVRSERYFLNENPHYLKSNGDWPLRDVIPAETLSSINMEAGSFGTVAHFRINIRKGTRTEQGQMIAQWTKAAEPITGNPAMGSFNDALIDGLWYAKQDHFLPLLEKWITNFKGTHVSAPVLLKGLAMRPGVSAFALLLKGQPKDVVNAFYSIQAGKIAEAIPICIGWLTHADDQVRSQSESLLTRWTGQSFEHTWEGYRSERPTYSEGQRMQPIWQTWWEKNRSTFKPRKR